MSQYRDIDSTSDDLSSDEWREVFSLFGWALLMFVVIWVVLVMLGAF